MNFKYYDCLCSGKAIFVKVSSHSHKYANCNKPNQRQVNPKLHNKYCSTHPQHDTMQFVKICPTLHSIKAFLNLNNRNINAKPQQFS